MLITELFDKLAVTRSRDDKIELLVDNDDWMVRFILGEAYGGKPKVRMPKDIVGTGDEFIEDIMQDIMGVNLTLNDRNSRTVVKTQVTRLFKRLEPAGASLIKKMLRRDLKCGVSVGTINKAYPGLITRLDFPKHKQSDVNKFPLYDKSAPNLIINSKINTQDCLFYKIPGSWRPLFKSGRELASLEYINNSLTALAEQLGFKADNGMCFIGKLCTSAPSVDVEKCVRQGTINTNIKFSPILAGRFGGFISQHGDAFKPITELWEPLPFLHRLPIIEIAAGSLPLVIEKYYAMGIDMIEVRYSTDPVGFDQHMYDIDTTIKPEFELQLIVPCVIIDVVTAKQKYPVGNALVEKDVIQYLVVRQENGKESIVLNGIDKEFRQNYLDNPTDIIGEVIKVQCRGYGETRIMNSPRYLSMVDDMFWESVELFVADNNVY